MAEASTSNQVDQEKLRAFTRALIGVSARLLEQHLRRLE
jgi:hypothetical protein